MLPWEPPSNPDPNPFESSRRDSRRNSKSPSGSAPSSDSAGDRTDEASQSPSKARTRKGRRDVRIWVAGGVVAIGLLVVVGSIVFFPPKAKESRVVSRTTKPKPRSSKKKAVAPAVQKKPEVVETVTCKITTPEPGFVVFIDDQPVRDEKDKLVLTPCEINIAPGTYAIRVAKKGWTDLPKLLEVATDETFEQTPTYEPFAETNSAIEAPYLEAAVGKPILLKSLVFQGHSQDPFIASSGREIYYASSGGEGMGIYYSTRPTPYHEWEAPSLLLLSRGADLPASPSATADGLLVAYTVPGRAGRVWGLKRKSVEASFDDKKPLYFLEQGEAEWPSAMLSGDGRRLYYLETRGEKTLSWVATRYGRDVEFVKGKKLALLGHHACLSGDELRQYHYDGKKLQRATRSKLTAAFGEPEVVAELELPGYVPHPDRRQFWVSDDEQWLYYAEDPAKSGNLFAVRLRMGPGIGTIVRGRSLKPDPVIAKTEDPQAPDPATKPETEKSKESKEEDPLALPIPYAAFLDQLVELLTKRETAAAAKIIADNRQKPELQADQPLLQWDSADLGEIQKFWQTAETAATELKPGDTLRIGGGSLTLEKYDAGVFTLKAKTKTVERKLSELTAGELLALVDKKIAKDDQAGQLSIGIFLYYEGKTQVQGSKTRLERAGSVGEEFLEHQAVRRLKIIEHELARQNLAVALKLIDELAAAYPQSPSIAAAEELRKKIYSFVKWTPRGDRPWDVTADGSYALSPEKHSGSMLVSSTDYDSFDLSLEWQATSPLGKGGVFFRYPGKGDTFENAFKVQLANDAGVRADKFCTGSLFNYAAPTANAAKSPPNWNTLSIQVRGEKVVVHINGQKVQDILATSRDVPKHGFVALDGEFGGITYRKVLLVVAVKSAGSPRK